ncbi:MAG: TetR/AcrR family transcriptional regulator, regulator of autoinduction and epiphytic fitness, partial [Chloroflexota bacterium]|nr:TetR/AcrR family transcriptional regulator, regulator of autoinduction and epiphytic fitness [Chloroflexota bacterium]
MEFRSGSNDAGVRPRRGGSREAIVEAAERLFLDRGFGSVSMDELAEAAGVARRTLYNQFSSKEEIFGKCSSECRVSWRTRFHP